MVASGIVNFSGILYIIKMRIIIFSLNRIRYNHIPITQLPVAIILLRTLINGFLFLFYNHLHKKSLKLVKKIV